MFCCFLFFYFFFAFVVDDSDDDIICGVCVWCMCENACLVLYFFKRQRTYTLIAKEIETVCDELGKMEKCDRSL